MIVLSSLLSLVCLIKIVCILPITMIRFRVDAVSMSKEKWRISHCSI